MLLLTRKHRPILLANKNRYIKILKETTGIYLSGKTFLISKDAEYKINEIISQGFYWLVSIQGKRKILLVKSDVEIFYK